MRSLAIEARSADSARALADALSEFKPELHGTEEEGYRVKIELGSFDREVVAVLEKLEQYVTTKSHEPAPLELDGRRYTVHSR